MPGFLGGSSGSGTGGEIRFPAEFIDPVTKLRVSEPQTLIDTDFEYGLQPTKWESVELINNTPSFFSKGGDTTIPNIAAITTTESSREIKVTTSLAHGLAVGIPINVSGTKSLTADGAYIINSVPDSVTFTYLCKQNQPESASIEDLYTSIVTGEFFQGSQIKIADSEGLVTNAAGNSVLTVTTESPHGFGINTPFYFLNLNSTISQEFDSSNTNSKAFDAANLSTAQTFDGSNSLVSYLVDLDNNAVLGGAVSTVSTVSLVNNTVTVQHTSENFVGKPVGTPLYHNVESASGYFATTPRGVVFLKSLPTSTVNGSIFTVSETPDGTVIPITSSVTGTFQLANEARTFAGNNLDSTTQTTLTIQKESAIEFDGGNQGYAGAIALNGLSEVLGYTGTTGAFLISTTAGAGLDYYVNAMVKYNSTGTVATSGGTNLVNNGTYFIASFATTGTANQYRITIKEFPDSATVLSPTGGTGTQTFNKIGVSVDKDIIHIKNASYVAKDLLEYSFPAGTSQRFTTAETAKLFYFVETAYDTHNYKLSENFFSAPSATGGITSTYNSLGTDYRIHAFTTVGTTNFVVSSAGTAGLVDILVVGGGGPGGSHVPGGGGAGGLIYRPGKTITAGTYPIVVGVGGTGSFNPGGYGGQPNATAGGDSTALGLTAKGGGWGQSWFEDNRSSNGGSGGGREGRNGSRGLATQPSQPGESGQYGFGNDGGNGRQPSWGNDPYPGAGGGGAGGPGTDQPNINTCGDGGPGRYYGSQFGTNFGQNGWFAGGGGGGSWGFTSGGRGAGGIGGGGAGDSPTGNGDGPSARGAGNTPTGVSGLPNTGGGGGGAGKTGGQASRGGDGGSGVVLIRYPLTEILPLTPTIATGGTITTATVDGLTYNVHTFSTPGQSAFAITSVGSIATVEVFAYGAGGGGGSPGGWIYGAPGGAGGYASGTVTVAAKTYAIMVGGGGSKANNTIGGGGGDASNNGISSLGFTAGGGAPSRPDGGDNRYGGQGGGLSGFFDNNTYNPANAILIAGGGGAGGSSRAGEGNVGGAGGGTTAADGSAPYDGQSERRGRGGTQGGTSLPNGGNSTNPTQFNGGVTSPYGGGGGGGWWGGSAGTYSESNTMGGGGGGSGYVHPTKVTGGSTVVGSGTTPPSGFTRPSGVGIGGAVFGNGGNGVVIVRYVTGRA
jgi:hypothetical protein